jgi:hypothetical protein
MLVPLATKIGIQVYYITTMRITGFCNNKKQRSGWHGEVTGSTLPGYLMHCAGQVSSTTASQSCVSICSTVLLGWRYVWVNSPWYWYRGKAAHVTWQNLHLVPVPSDNVITISMSYKLYELWVVFREHKEVAQISYFMTHLDSVVKWASIQFLIALSKQA